MADGDAVWQVQRLLRPDGTVKPNWVKGHFFQKHRLKKKRPLCNINVSNNAQPIAFSKKKISLGTVSQRREVETAAFG